ncbi:metal-dependent hydrolase [Clostridiaceae bacterium M8S5]|nr:metal-dependent hydrolase [Clostridiaceae bacterium M8S5]
MQGKTHTVIATATALLVSKSFFTPNTALIFSAGAVLGALIPDIDHNKSKINNLLHIKNNTLKKLIYVLFGAILISIAYSYDYKNLYFGAIYIGLLGFAHHRGFTHSLLSLTIFLLAIYPFRENNNIFYDGIALGYATHIVSDMFTKHGVELLYPWSKNIRFMFTMTTGSKAETILNYSLSVLIVILFCYQV